jgi:hypothetical protein
VVGSLEDGAVGPHVPKPSTRRAVRYGKLMAMMLMKALDKFIQIVAVRIWKSQADFEYAMFL